MANFNIIDRRLNPGGKNLSNRQRFLRKATEQLKKSVKDGLLDRSITSSDDQNVHVPSDGIYEPSFRNDSGTGSKEYILPGNTDMMPGDLIEKPRGGAGGGGSAGSDSGEGEDNFQFQISKDEFNSILFDGLELPDLIKKNDKRSESYVRVRAGFTNSGNPATLDLEHSMIRSLGRRIALKNPKLKKIKKLEEELLMISEKINLTEDDKIRIAEIEADLKTLHRKVDAISYLDPIDLRYKNFDKKIVPKHQAVMFCIMDVSGSMGEHEKDLAKRFYLLLYLFLSYKYQKVDIVYIRHHSTATECDENQFFYSKETGGTIVSEGFSTMQAILQERYAIDEWNVYVGACSDGDNFEYDNPVLSAMLSTYILPNVQSFSYLQVASEYGFQNSDDTQGLWKVYSDLSAKFQNIQMRKVSDPKHVYSIFRGFFENANTKSTI